MALVDLRFASPTERKKFTCANCHSVVKKGRRCEEDGFFNIKSGMAVGAGSLTYSFCPGKATWYPEAAELYEQCQLAMETGIMPKGPLLDDQDFTFTLTLGEFIERWRERQYQRVWGEVGEYVNRTLKAIFGEK